MHHLGVHSSDEVILGDINVSDPTVYSTPFLGDASPPFVRPPQNTEHGRLSKVRSTPCEYVPTVSTVPHDLVEKATLASKIRLQPSLVDSVARQK